MKRPLCLVIPLLLVVITVALPGCTGGSGGSKDIVSGSGTIKFIDLEGGFYGIVGDDGNHYDPLNLAEEFQNDSLPVRFEIKIVKDVATIRMWGTPVEIIKMEKLR